MPTKTKKSKSTNRGRPKKEFKSMKKNKDTNIKRKRGRPKKSSNIKKTDSVNTRISKHGKDIKKLSKNNNKIHLDIKDTTFSSKKIKKTKNKKSDRFALGLLIFSMLLFIFSLYKTFYLDSDHILKKQIDNDIIISTWSTITEDVSKDNWKLIVENWELEEKDENIKDEDITVVVEPQWMNIIKNFYQKINQKKFEELVVFVDNYIKFSNVFNTYYTENWMWNFLSHLNNEKIYITNLEQMESEKENVEYYTYNIKYKLKNNNEMFEEKWKVAIVDKWWEKMIWSIQCINTGCSKMPFFNPQIHWIK